MLMNTENKGSFPFHGAKSRAEPPPRARYEPRGSLQLVGDALQLGMRTPLLPYLIRPLATSVNSFTGAASGEVLSLCRSFGLELPPLM